jgi:hypothetical protein
MPDSFSQRHGFAGTPLGTLLRDEIPVSFREFLTNIGHEDVGLELHEVRSVVCDVLQKYPNDSLPPYFDARNQIRNCKWFEILDMVEGLFKAAYGKDYYAPYPGGFVKAVNAAFEEFNIGWQLDATGKVVTRGDKVFEYTVRTALQGESQRQTARKRIREAIDDLSRRPEPDLSGAIFHAFAAMECVMGDIQYTPEEIRADTHHTFGKFLKEYPDLFPSEDFKSGLQLLWKYANNEGSRHGKEGMEPGRDEAELIVSVAAALVTYLNRKHN